MTSHSGQPTSRPWIGRPVVVGVEATPTEVDVDTRGPVATRREPVRPRREQREPTGVPGAQRGNPTREREMFMAVAPQGHAGHADTGDEGGAQRTAAQLERGRVLEAPLDDRGAHFGQTSSRFSTMRSPAAYCELDARLDRVLGDATVPLAQRHPQLAAGEVRTEAAMHTPAEREVTVDVAVESHLHRVGVLGGVDVGRAHVDEHERTLPARCDRRPGTPSVAMRGTFGTGVSQRSSSSTALGMMSGWSTIWRR